MHRLVFKILLVSLLLLGCKSKRADLSRTNYSQSSEWIPADVTIFATNGSKSVHRSLTANFQTAKYKHYNLYRPISAVQISPDRIVIGMEADFYVRNSKGVYGIRHFANAGLAVHKMHEYASTHEGLNSSKQLLAKYISSQQSSHWDDFVPVLMEDKFSSRSSGGDTVLLKSYIVDADGILMVQMHNQNDNYSFEVWIDTNTFYYIRGFRI